MDWAAVEQQGVKVLLKELQGVVVEVGSCEINVKIKNRHDQVPSPPLQSDDLRSISILSMLTFRCNFARQSSHHENEKTRTGFYGGKLSRVGDSQGGGEALYPYSCPVIDLKRRRQAYSPLRRIFSPVSFGLPRSDLILKRFSMATFASIAR
jgi:hypothetical protein